MSNDSFLLLSMELIGSDEGCAYNMVNCKWVSSRRGIWREMLFPSGKTLYDLHECIQKAFGWKNFYLHKFALSDEDFICVTKGNPNLYEVLCGVIFRSLEAQCFDWYWHDLRKSDPDLLRHSIEMEGSFYNEKRRIYKTARKKSEPSFSKSGYPSESVKLTPETNCLIERLSAGEIFKPDHNSSGRFHLRENVDEWRIKTLHSASLCMSRLSALKDSTPKEFMAQNDALEELDSWEKSFEQLLRIRANPLSAVSRLGINYEEAKKRHIETFHLCFEKARDIVENYNPRLEPFFGELIYRYDKGEDWAVRVRCLDVFEAKGISNSNYSMDENCFEHTKSTNMVAEPISVKLKYWPKEDESLHDSDNASVWIDYKKKLVSEKMKNLLNKANRTFSPMCIRANGVSVMEDIGGVKGFSDFLRTLRGRDREASRRVRHLAEIYGWSEKNDPTHIDF